MLRKTTYRAAALAGALALAVSGASAETGVTDDEILIGDITILSGPAKFVGDGVTLGTRIAVEEINANGGVNGRKIKVLTEDDGYIPARTVQATRKLIEQDGIFALSGTSGSSNVLAILPIIEEANLPVVVTTAPNSKIYEGGPPKSVYTLGPDYSVPFYAQVKYIHENIAKDGAKYGLIIQDDDFGDSIEAGYERAVEEFGLDDVIRTRFKKGQKDFSAEMLKLKSEGVDVLVSGGIFAGNASIMQEARKLGMDDLTIATVWTSRMPIPVKLLSPHKFPYLVADYVVARADPAAQAFKEAAAEFVGEDAQNIDRYSLVSYVGMKVLAEAMRGCGENLTRACTIEQLGKIENFDARGLMAPITFDEENQLSGTAVKIYQFDPEGGDFESLTDFQTY